MDIRISEKTKDTSDCVRIGRGGILAVLLEKKHVDIRQAGTIRMKSAGRDKTVLILSSPHNFFLHPN